MNIAPISNLFEQPVNPPTLQTSSNPQNPPKKTPNEIQQDFLKSCEGLWKDRNLTNSFNKGVLLGASDSKDFNLDVFLRRVLKVFEDHIKERYSDNNLPLNQVRDVFNVFKSNCNILKSSLDKDLISSSTNSEELIAIFHGFMSSFVLKDKEQ